MNKSFEIRYFEQLGALSQKASTKRWNRKDYFGYGCDSIPYKHRISKKEKFDAPTNVQSAHHKRVLRSTRRNLLGISSVKGNEYRRCSSRVRFDIFD